MSWSLQVQHGDLVLSGSRYATVTGMAKLVQDLTFALLEPMGTDDMHPSYGSLLDGGRLPSGQTTPSVIGMDAAQVTATVQAEVQRVTRAYQSQQLARAKSDQTNYNRVSLSPGEVLLNVSSVDLEQVNDVLLVNITLLTGDEGALSLTIPVATDS